VLPIGWFAACVCAACADGVPRQHFIKAPVRASATAGNSKGIPASVENATFEGVMLGQFDNPNVDIFPVGERALVTVGATVIGYVERGGPIVRDATLSKGLPNVPGNKISFLVGDWPDGLVALVGSFTGSGNPGNHHAYVRRNDNWTRIDSIANAGWDVPTSVAWDKDSLWVHVPENFQVINGTLVKGQYPCTGSHRLRLENVRFGKGANVLPEVDADFFPLDVIADAKGQAYIWGWSACRPGLFVGALGREHVKLELVPGSNACTERAKFNDLPSMTVRAFPAIDQGIYWLVYPSNATAAGAVPSCEGPTIYHRAGNGTWSARVLPRATAAWSTTAAEPYVDPEGVLWAATANATVIRWTDKDVPTEYPLGPSCAHAQFNRDGEDQSLTLDAEHPVEKIVSASPSDIWAVVQYDQVQGLCRLRNSQNRIPSLSAASSAKTR